MQAQRADQPQVLPRPSEAMRHLHGVVPADHVVSEDDIALPRKVDCATWHGVELGILEAPVAPVPVRGHDGRKLALPRLAGPVQVAAKVEAGMRLEEHAGDRVVVVVDPVAQTWMQRPTLRQWQEPRGEHHSLA